MLYQHEARSIVAAWCEVKRDIAAFEPESPEYAALHAEARRLREEYQRVVDEARLHLRPEPPPFPVRLTLTTGGGT